MRSPSAGGAVVLASLVAVAAVAHHPTVSHARSAADVIAQILALRNVDQTVHGVLIAATGLLVYGFAVFAMRLGLDRDAVLAGVVAYVLGTVAVIGAALLDGFLIPAIAARYAAGTPDQLSIAVQLVTVCALAIQICTKLWLFAVSVAVVLWSAVLVRRTPVQTAIAILGFASSAAIIGMAAAGGSVNPHSLGIVVLVQLVWNVAVGVLMLRGDV